MRAPQHGTFSCLYEITSTCVQALRILYLQDNALKRLPDSIGKLENLEVLDLSFNNLTVIPSMLPLLTTSLKVRAVRVCVSESL